MKNRFFLILVLVAAVSCSPKQWSLIDLKTAAIPIDASTEAIADPGMRAFIAPIKLNLDREMNQVIGETTEEMRSGKPESLLSNLNADIYLKTASDYLRQSVDLAIVNV